MKRILITGANGQLGSELKALVTRFNDADCLFATRNVLPLHGSDVFQNVLQLKPDVIVNCAAYTAVDKAESDADTAHQVNAIAAGEIARAATESGAALIHISTDFVFDGQSPAPYKEDAATNPLGVYGRTKLAGEELVMAHCPAAVIIRTGWVYSTFGNNFVKTILRLCKERPSLNVIYDQVGTPTYAADLADAIVQIVNGRSSKWVPGIYHYSNEGVCSWYDFAMAIRDLAALQTPISPIETHQYPTPAKRPQYSVLNKAKIRDTYNLTIPYWRHSLQRCMQQL